MPKELKNRVLAKNINLLAHENLSLKDEVLVETTHKGASARWLSLSDKYCTVNGMQELMTTDTLRTLNEYHLYLSNNSRYASFLNQIITVVPESTDMVLVYRHMSDREFVHLQVYNQLPDTQPYQTIVCNETCNGDNKQCIFKNRHDKRIDSSWLAEDETVCEGDNCPGEQEGFKYCMKYFTGKKKVDTNVTTIVQFLVQRQLVDTLFSMFAKAEDGVMSHGLGNKGGKGLPYFNRSLAEGTTHWIVRLVKRSAHTSNVDNYERDLYEGIRKPD